MAVEKDAVFKMLDWNRVESVARLGKQAIPALTEAVKSDIFQRKARAILALGLISHRKAVPMIIEALHDPDCAIRDTAAEALGNKGGKRAVFALMGALEDPHFEVVISAAKALGKMGDQNAVPSLIAALSSRSKVVRNVIVQTLVEISLGARIDMTLVRDALNENVRSADKEERAEVLDEAISNYMRIALAASSSRTAIGIAPDGEILSGERPKAPKESKDGMFRSAQNAGARKMRAC